MSNVYLSPAARRATPSSPKNRILLVVLMAFLLIGAVASPAAAKTKKDKADKGDTTTESTFTSARSADTATSMDGQEPLPEIMAASGDLLDPVSETVATRADVENPLGDIVNAIGAEHLWEQGITGEGVHVAVIDTGVAPVPALAADDKVIALVDLSFESANPELAFIDNHGHGTHMAGIIAGSDPATGFRGVAPDAGIVSVKVGDSNGVVDVSQVIAAIDWVVANKDSEGLNIRVLNLSYGTDGTQDYRIDPLMAAVGRAWDAGIVVVVATGNDGRSGWGLANPALNPYVIAVGAADISKSRPKAASFSTSAEDDRPIDVIAPGAGVPSLRVPDSTIDREHPEGRVGDDLFLGSGSSQSAAVVSGGVALLLEARPDLSPDQIKYLLRTTAASAQGPEWFVGSGMIDIAAAATTETPGVEAIQTWPRSTGDGSLEAARGSIHVAVDGVVLEGEVTVTGATWTGATWTGATWTGATWTGATWTGATWTGATWTGATWTGATWTGATWTGATWTGATWG